MAVSKKIKANVLESGFHAFDGISARSTFYIFMNMSSAFEFDVFQESLMYVFNQVEKLNGHLVKGFLKDKWEERKILSREELPLESRELLIDSWEELEDEFFKILEQEEDIAIDLERESPLKIKRYFVKDGKQCMLLFAFQHGFTDGRGALQLINYIGECYQSRLRNIEYRKVENTYSIQEIIRSFPKEHKKSEWDKEQDRSAKKMQNLYRILEKELVRKEHVPKRNVERIVWEQEFFQKIQVICRHMDWTINDFIMLVILKATYELQKNADEEQSCVGCASAVDVRKYLKNQDFFVGDCAINENFIVKSEVFERLDYVEYTEQIKNFKKKILGKDFFSAIGKLEWMPSCIFRPLISSFIKAFSSDAMQKGISVSNCGNISNYLPFWAGIIENAVFTPTVNKFGLPQIGVSSYNHTLTITMIKENDRNGSTTALREILETEVSVLVKDLEKRIELEEL